MNGSFASDVRIQIDKEKHYAYPDIFVVCGELEFAEKRKDMISNPVLIAEVLSDSTQDYDRGSKFTAYRNFLKTLREYVLIEQKRIHVEHFSKEDDGTWRLREYFSLDDVLNIESLRCEVPLRDVYKRVKFKPSVYVVETK